MVLFFKKKLIRYRRGMAYRNWLDVEEGSAMRLIREVEGKY